MPNPEAGPKPTVDQAIRKHSVTISGHRTSLSLEQAFWNALKDQARVEGLSAAALIEKIDRDRSGNLSSAIRIYLLDQAMDRTRRSGS